MRHFEIYPLLMRHFEIYPLLMRHFKTDNLQDNSLRCVHQAKLNLVWKWDKNLRWKRRRCFVTMDPTGPFPREFCKKGKFCLGSCQFLPWLKSFFTLLLFSSSYWVSQQVWNTFTKYWPNKKGWLLNIDPIKRGEFWILTQWTGVKFGFWPQQKRGKFWILTRLHH